MRVPSARFACLAASFLALAPACNAIFGVEAGTAPPATGTGGASSTASHGVTGGAGTGGTGGSAGCVASCSQGMLTLCDAAGQPMPAKDCGAVALCDAVGQVCTTPPSIALGYRRGCAVDENHAVYCWGYNDGSPLQTGTLVLGDDHLMFPTPQLMDLQGVTAWQISVGDDHQCALQANGQVACWGDNENDQLGIEVPGDPSLNPMVDLPRNAVEVAAGAQCTCARLDDGTVWCWGLQDDGCLGDGTAGNNGVGVATPTEIPLGNQAVQIRAGDGRYTPFCARLTGGLVRCWGRGYGPITIPTVASATDISVGPLTVFINTPDGLVWTQPLRPKAPATQVTFPDPQPFPVVTAPVTKLAAAYDLCTVGSSKPAEVSCTGLFNLEPPVTGFPQPVSVTVPGPVLDLASGTGENYDSTMQCARVSGPAFAESVYCWGDDSLGELGIGGPAYYLTPQKVTLDAAVSVACTESSTAAVLADGTAHYWGFGSAYVDDGQADFPSPPIPGVGSAPIALSGNDSWGWAYAIQDGGAPPPLLVPGSSATGPARLLTYSSTSYVAAVPALADLGLLTSGQVVVYADAADPSNYGANDCGIFGDGTQVTSTTGPTAKTVPLPSTAVAIAAHGTDYDSCPAHACAILSTGALYCWGSNGSGESAGSDMSTSVMTPAQVMITGVTQPIVSVATGFEFSCATDGTAGTGQVYCWGVDDYGELGTGSTLSYSSNGNPVPAAVAGIASARGVTAGDAHACAWLADGTAVCWGQNDYGQLGNGNFDDQPGPVAVKGLKDVAAMSAGTAHTCALLTDGSVWCWGSSENGQVGLGKDSGVPVPTMVVGL